MNKILLAFCVCVAMAATSVTASATSPVELPYASLGPVFDNAADGTLIHQQRIALNRGTGLLYTTDDVGDQVRVFGPTGVGASEGTAFGAGDLTDPLGVAVDQDSGAIYVSDDNDIVKYASDGTLDPDFVSPGVTGPLAYDQNADELVVADTATNRIRRYDGATGAAGASFDGSDDGDAFIGLQDLAVAPSGDVYVIDADGDLTLGATSRVEKYSAVGHHEATVGPVAGAATIAVNATGDRLIVSGNQGAVNTNDNPTLDVFDTADLTTSAERLPTDISMQYDTIRGLAVDDGPAARLYVGTDIGNYGTFDTYGRFSLQVYERPVQAVPEVTGVTATPTGADGAKLIGAVNPHMSSTSYYFEYGTGSDYGSAVPVAKNGDVGDGDDPVTIARFVVGLQPGTTYHYRLVATNGLGTTPSGDKTFKTPAAPTATDPAADACPNADVRAQQRSTALPDCRAYEMVSPVDKNGSDVLGFDTDVHSSENGDRVTFASFSGFADAATVRYVVQYLAQRGPSGWSTQSLIPQQDFGDSFHGSGLPMVTGASTDLAHTILNGRDPAPAPGAQPGTFNLFTRDTLGGGFGLLTSAGVVRPSNQAFADASEDFSHILFESKAKLTADAPIDNPTGTDPYDRPNLYERVDGLVRLVGVLPDGTPAPEGAMAGTFNGTNQPSGALDGLYTDETMSRDGSTIFWTDVATNQIYARLGGTRTVAVSASQRSVPEPDRQPSRFEGATPDGSIAFFTSEEKLTDDSAAAVGHFADLYAYDVQADRLTDLMSVPGKHAYTFGVLGASDDGSSVYFVAFGDGLAPGAPAGQANIYLWRKGSPLTFVAGLPNVSFAEQGPDAVNWANGASANGNHIARVSDSGRELLFSSVEPQTGEPTGGHSELYRYDADQDAMACVSCPPSGAPATVDARLFTTAPEAQGAIVGASPFLINVLSSDGKRVFFQTAESLVSGDTNGRQDVYEWEAGEPHLISSGQADSDSILGDASLNGDAVFFTTHQSLVAGDEDNNADLYVARVNGGSLVSQPAAPCTGDPCQGAPSAAPSAPVVGSITFMGPGNPSSGRPAAGGAKVTVSRPATVHGSVATLKVRVPAAGTVTVSGASVRKASKRATKASTVNVKVTLTAKAAATLRKKHSLRAKVAVTFAPRSGSATKASLTLTFARATAKKQNTTKKQRSSISRDRRSASKGAR